MKIGTWEVEGSRKKKNRERTHRHEQRYGDCGGRGVGGGGGEYTEDKWF